MALTKIDDRGLKTPIDLLDSESIRLGTGNDLQLYANGSNSYIQHSGDGDFYVQTGQTDEDLYLIAGSSVFIKPTGGSDHGIKVLKNGAVELYHDNSKKAETTANGLSISSYELKLNAASGASAQFHMYGNGPTNNNDMWRMDAGSARWDLYSYQGSGVWATHIKCSDGGAVELYHDNSKKLETTSVGVNITDGEVRIGDAADGNDALIRLGATGSDADTHGVIAYDKSSNYLSLVVSGESHGGGGILIANGGNVGINEVSPSYQLDVKGDSGIYASAGSNSTAAQITISGRNSSGSGSALSRLKSYPDGSSNQSHFAIETRNSSATMVEAIRITSDQRVGIGTTSPSNLVHIEKSHADPLVVIKNTSGQANEGACLKLWASGRGSGVDDEDIFVINDTNNARNFGVSNAGTVNTTGNIVMASGKGINFSATSDAGGRTSELLDDYEEGTWTPAAAQGTLSVITAHYVKIGSIVYIQAYGNFDSSSSSSDQNITGLPFASSNSSDYGTVAVNSNANLGYNLVGQIDQGQPHIIFAKPDNSKVTGANMSGKFALFQAHIIPIKQT